LRVEDWEQRWIAETLSWDSFKEKSKYKMGRQYFTSFGVENDFYMQLFHYANFKSTLGVFRGLGDFGEWRFNWSIQSYLDL
jgi:hypothetical protein